MTELSTTPSEAEQDFLSRPLLTTLNLDWEKTIYFLFILLAILTRFWDLGSRVMSHDESLHTQFSYQFYNGDGYNHTPLMHGPFLFHITAVAYWLFGDSDLSARIPVAIFGVLLVAMPYLFRKWLGQIGGLFTSFIFLISPYLTYYSRYIRHDIYIIVWALIVFSSIWFYLNRQEEKYLWWFAAGTALMFATKEVAFIYVAIFGSFLILRLFSQIVQSNWFGGRNLAKLRIPIMVTLLGLLIIAGGFIGQQLVSEVTIATETGEVTEGFAADPSQEPDLESEPAVSVNEKLTRWTQVIGIAVFSLGLFLIVQGMRPHIDQHPEADLIVLFTTLILPTASPLLTTIAGWDPRDYTVSSCMLEGQESMTSLQLLLARAGNSICWSSFLNSGVVRSGVFLMLTLVVAVLVGLWWNRKRWIVAAVIFHGIFVVLYTSVFTNPGGWTSGMIGSLGYWLEQQDVQRGSQPTFYYFFVVPFYEFLPLIFSLASIRLWMQKQKINKLVGYWLTLILSSWLIFSLSNWLFSSSGVPVESVSTGSLSLDLFLAFLVILLGGISLWRWRKNVEDSSIRWISVLLRLLLAFGVLFRLARNPLVQLESEPSRNLSIILATLVLGVGIIYWFLNRRRQLLVEYELKDNLSSLVDTQSLVGFVPSLIWWLLLTVLVYSYAGEKMPWLSAHFVIPMAFLAGWYINEKLADLNLRAHLTPTLLQLLGLTVVLIVVILLALGPLLLGKIQFGNQELENLSGIGRFLGSLVIAGGIFYLWQQLYRKTDSPVRSPILTLSIFALLSLLTIRFNYMASFPNADYSTEFMVYAHGAPSTKNVVMEQVEELSMRLHGDKSIKVAFSQDTSWPFTWYLRDYPNRVFFGDSPSHTLTESPIILVGNLDWTKTEPYLGNEYEQSTYTYLWWPMEEYRKISWGAIFGGPSSSGGRGLLNADVRQAIWDIFFYRDYDKYGQVFGGTYSTGQWPLRHEMRLYIRKDVLADLWDYGVGAITVESLQDPYAENDLQLAPIMVLNESGIAGAGLGELFAPRNVAVGPDGRIYVADSSNHRIQVFDPEGTFVNAWGSSGTEPGNFNEPWGILVANNHVYVTDTWNHRIQRFTLDGELDGIFGQSGSPTDESELSLGLFFGPRDIISLDDVRLLVTDTGNHRMQLMDLDGNFIQQVGNFGNLLGQLNEPVGLGIGPDGSFFLADTWNSRIQRFSPDFFGIDEWEVDAWDSSTTNNKPYLAVDSAGRVYVTDPEGYRVLIFSDMGDYLGRFGNFGTDVNSFGLPNGIAIDAEDNVYISDAGNNRILKFAPIFGAPQLSPVDEQGENLNEVDTEIEGDNTGADQDGPVDEADSSDVDSDAIESDDTGDSELPTPTESNEDG